MGTIGRKVIFKTYDMQWPLAFQVEAAALRKVFGDVLVDIQHIGSTSIPGMSAKPIIDIMIEARSLVEVDLLNERMAEIGYTARGEQGIPGRRYFRKGPDNDHTHHLHIYQTGDANLAIHTAFRDYLTAHPDRAHDYASLKQRLSEEHFDDPAAYQDGKAALAQEIVAEAQEWWSGRIKSTHQGHVEQD